MLRRNGRGSSLSRAEREENQSDSENNESGTGKLGRTKNGRNSVKGGGGGASGKGKGSTKKVAENGGTGKNASKNGNNGGNNGSEDNPEGEETLRPEDFTYDAVFILGGKTASIAFNKQFLSQDTQTPEELAQIISRFKQIVQGSGEKSTSGKSTPVPSSSTRPGVSSSGSRSSSRAGSRTPTAAHTRNGSTSSSVPPLTQLQTIADNRINGNQQAQTLDTSILSGGFGFTMTGTSVTTSGPLSDRTNTLKKSKTSTSSADKLYRSRSTVSSDSAANQQKTKILVPLAIRRSIQKQAMHDLRKFAIQFLLPCKSLQRTQLDSTENKSGQAIVNIEDYFQFPLYSMFRRLVRQYVIEGMLKTIEQKYFMDR